MKDFAGKIAVITGGGTGMGRELARQLVAEGPCVAREGQEKGQEKNRGKSP